MRLVAAVSGEARRRPVFVVERRAVRPPRDELRLERGGLLSAWVLPQGVPTEPGARALAVRGADRPLGRAAGRAGAGRATAWDRGTYETLEEGRDGRLTVRLAGRRLRGTWTLLPAGLGGAEERWLLVRRRAAGEAAVPGTYRPMLATLAAGLPAGRDWRYEVKFDGYRVLAYVRAGACELVSRGGAALTARFPEVARALPPALRAASAVVDGELCALDEEGRPSFSALQRGTGRRVLYLFDLLEVDGDPLGDCPLAYRQARLAELLARRSRTVLRSESFDDGRALLAAARRRGLEGVMAKRAGSAYAEGRRSRDWLKVKAHARQEFVVAGYTRGRGRRASSFGSLVLAVNEGGRLRYAGNVGTGFDEREIARLLALLRPLEREQCPFPEPPAMPRVRKGDVVWVEPKLVAEVAFREWTPDGLVRQPSYRGLREDKPVREVRRERPAGARRRSTPRRS